MLFESEHEVLMMDVARGALSTKAKTELMKYTQSTHYYHIFLMKNAYRLMIHTDINSTRPGSVIFG